MALILRSSGPEPASGSRNDADDGRQPRPTRVVRYGAMRWVGEFPCKPGQAFGRGGKVVVQTDRGIELGESIGVTGEAPGWELLVPRDQMQAYLRESGPEFCRPRAGRILRPATDQDVNEHDRLNAHVCEDIRACAELAHQLGLDMKIITAEHLLGGERIVFYFGSTSRVDFRQLVRELAQRYRTRIEMRQVGARDEARLVGDYEVCGRECCCRNFLKKLRPVNMKMAKLQKSTLDPTKVSGRCGRLRCCLRYEHCGYEEFASRLPRVGSRVQTELGPATVLDRQILTQLVSVRIDDDRVVTIPQEEILAFNLPPAPPREPPPGSQASQAAPVARTDSQPPESIPRPRQRDHERDDAESLPVALASEPSLFVPDDVTGEEEEEAGLEPTHAEAADASAEPGRPLDNPDQDRMPAPENEPPAAPAANGPPRGPGRRRRRGRRRRGPRRGGGTPPAGEGSAG